MKLPSVKTRIAAMVGVLVAAALFAPSLGSLALDFLTFIDGLGAWGVVLFVVAYALISVALVPASILTLAAGALFGVGMGFLWVVVGALLGAVCCFWLARTIAHEPVQRMLADRPGVRRIDRAVSRQGARIVFLLRLSPVMPFGLLNYTLGVSSVRFRDYIFGHFGTLPASFFYVYYGAALGSLAAVASGRSVERGVEYWIFLGLGMVATLLAAIQITRVARRALAAEHLDLDDPTDGHPEVPSNS